MNCSEAGQFFDAYLDGELSGSLRLEFDAHRLRCPVCQQKLAMMEACEHILSRDSHMPELSGSFTHRVMRQIGTQRLSVRNARRRRFVIAAAVALQAAAVLLIVVFWPGASDQTSNRMIADGGTEFVEEVGLAIEAKSEVKLYELIYARADQLVAARSNFRNEMSALARYAANLSVLGDLSPLPESTTLSPWGGLLRILVPTTPVETEPAPSATGSFSL